MRSARGLDPFLGVALTGIEGMTSLPGHLFQVAELSAPIPLSKRVHIVYVSDDLSSLDSKHLMVQSAEEVRRLERSVDIGDAAFNQLGGDDGVAAFGQLNGSQFACAFVDVLKQVSVDGLQVSQVEVSLRGGRTGHSDDVGPASLWRPPLTFEHLEHGGFLTPLADCPRFPDGLARLAFAGQSLTGYPSGVGGYPACEPD